MKDTLKKITETFRDDTKNVVSFLEQKSYLEYVNAIDFDGLNSQTSVKQKLENVFGISNIFLKKGFVENMLVTAFEVNDINFFVAIFIDFKFKNKFLVKKVDIRTYPHD